MSNGSDCVAWTGCWSITTTGIILMVCWHGMECMCVCLCAEYAVTNSGTPGAPIGGIKPWLSGACVCLFLFPRSLSSVTVLSDHAHSASQRPGGKQRLRADGRLHFWFLRVNSKGVREEGPLVMLACSFRCVGIRRNSLTLLCCAGRTCDLTSTRRTESTSCRWSCWVCWWCDVFMSSLYA